MNLLQTMKRNKLTKNRVSKITGLSVPTVRKYVNEPGLFPVRNAKQIAEELGMMHEHALMELF
jgi:predicted transcriptional regulator